MKVHEILNRIQFSEDTRNTVVIHRQYLGMEIFNEEDVDHYNISIERQKGIERRYQMKFKELYKVLSVGSVELYNQKSQTGKPFYVGKLSDLSLSTYLDIEEVEVLEISVVSENNSCVVLIELKGTWGERE